MDRIMKKINISTMKFPKTFALVDDCDYKELSKHKWCAAEQAKGQIYARRGAKVRGIWTTVTMHTVIMGQVKGKRVDHRKGNGLDNRRCNLRHCTCEENGYNRKINTNNKSGYKGVSWSKASMKWQAQIQYSRKKAHLGFFTCLIKAAKAYDKAANKYHGEFARINFQ